MAFLENQYHFENNLQKECTTDEIKKVDLTYDGKKNRKVVGHDKQIDSLKIGTCFQVTKGKSYVTKLL